MSSSTWLAHDELRRGNSFPPHLNSQQPEQRPQLYQHSRSAGSRPDEQPNLVGWDAFGEQQPQSDSQRTTASAALDGDEDIRWSAARRAFLAAGQRQAQTFDAERQRSKEAYSPMPERSPSATFPSLTPLVTALPNSHAPQEARWTGQAAYPARDRLPHSSGRNRSHGSVSTLSPPHAYLRPQHLHHVPQQPSAYSPEHLTPLPPSPVGGTRLSPHSDPGFASAWSSQHSSPGARTLALPNSTLSAPPEYARASPRSPFLQLPPAQAAAAFTSRHSSAQVRMQPFHRQWHSGEADLPAGPGSLNSSVTSSPRLGLNQWRESNEGHSHDERQHQARRGPSQGPRMSRRPSPPAAASPAKPAPPAGPRLRSGLPERTTWAMWMGNIPADTTERELRRFFESRPKLGNESLAAGVESIHLIARSNCCFCNFRTSELLMHAIQHSHGVPLRPNDRKCKPLVCRLRMREDDAKSGVGAQRGAGLHKTYIRERRKSVPTPDRASSPESDSTTSTTSTFFDEHFPRRYFIMKAHSTRDLESSLRTGLWSTQSHNESVLDQAYRTSREGVFLVFSANKSGSWFGVAKMDGPISSSSLASPEVDKNVADGDGREQAGVAKASGMVSPVELSPTSQNSSLDGGTPFRVQWLAISNVPFVATKHILNAFNANREIKISRDGTEIEPEAGQQLLRQFGLFNPRIHAATGFAETGHPRPLESS
ncbi:hypothetical protein ACM66B_004008 [Microbotryomycetes sp. NB124-2]